MMMNENKFSLRVYFQAMTGLLGEPRRFFADLPEDIGFKVPLNFLMVSSLFFSLASLFARPCANPLQKGFIYFVNAVGMAVIAAVIGYIVINMISYRRVAFARILSIYAFATGVTLMASWIPTFFFITEPWKWLLIWAGLVKSCKVSWWRGLFIIVASIAIIVSFFYSLVPLIFK